MVMTVANTFGIRACFGIRPDYQLMPLIASRLLRQFD